MASSKDSAKTGKSAMAAFFAAMALLAFAVYSPLFRAPFLFDDHSVVLGDHAVATGGDGKVSHVDLFEGLVEKPRPVRQLSHRIDAAVFGAKPAAAHVENVCLHFLTALFGFLLLRRIGRSRAVAAAAAAFFLLNPVCVETLGVVSHRKEILATMFSMLGLLAVFAQPRKIRFPALAMFFLAAFSKETAVVFPLLAAAAASTADDKVDRTVRRTLFGYAIFAVLLAGLAFLQIQHSMAATGGNPAVDAFRAGHFGLGTPFIVALGAAIRAFPRWIACLAWPLGHSLDPPFLLEAPFFSAGTAVGLAAIALMAAALVRTKKSRSALFSPLAWCLAALLPYMLPPLIQRGATQVLADRYAYCASFGLAWAVAEAVVPFVGSSAFRVALVAAAAVFYGACAHVLARSFESEITLWRRVCAINPRSFQASHNLAMALWREGGDFKAADAEFSRMTSLRPDFDYGICSRAQTMAEAGFPRRAATILDKALKARPASVQLLRQRGIVKFGLGDMDGAAGDFCEAEKYGAGDRFFRLEYAEALLRTARWSKARKQYLLASSLEDSHEARREAALSALLVSDPPRRRGPLAIAGDSVPHGTAAVGPDGKEHGLAEMLEKEFRGLRTADLSVPGSRADGLAQTVRQAAKAGKPICTAGSVVIWTGHNDAFFGDTAETILRSIALAALEVRKAGARPVVVGPIPVVSAPGRDRRNQEQTLAILNEKEKAFCKDAGMTFVDIRSVLGKTFSSPQEALDAATGNHLTLRAMEIAAKAVAAALSEP